MKSQEGSDFVDSNFVVRLSLLECHSDQVAEMADFDQMNLRHGTFLEKTEQL